MPAQVQPVPASDVPMVEVTLQLSPWEAAALGVWADECVQAEFEHVEDLRALGRPHTHEMWRACFALELVCTLEMLKAPAR